MVKPERHDPECHDVAAPAGLGRLSVTRAEDEIAVLVLGHGAGGGIGSFDLQALARGLPSRGVTVALFEQPWVLAGRRVAGPPASLDEAWTPALTVVREVVDAPLFVGGRSAGARVACRTLPPDAHGLVLASFPLHPPGQPDASRIHELADAAASALVLQGERDPFGTPDELRAAIAGTPQSGERSVHGLPGVHWFGPRAPKPPSAADADVAAAMVDLVAKFIATHRRSV